MVFANDFFVRIRSIRDVALRKLIYQEEVLLPTKRINLRKRQVSQLLQQKSRSGGRDSINSLVRRRYGRNDL